jgi:hypothetical protein
MNVPLQVRRPSPNSPQCKCLLKRLMSIISIVFSTEYIFATVIYALVIIICLPCFTRIRGLLGGALSLWCWDNIAAPLLRTFLILFFLLLAYPIIFAVKDSPHILALLKAEDLRINYLINLIFVVTILFPLIPILGKREELILPIQAITASAMLFSWLASELGVADIRYLPGLYSLLTIVALAFLTYWLAQKIAHYFGDAIDEKLNLKDSGTLLSRALILFMQSPAIAVYCSALGRQLI